MTPKYLATGPTPGTASVTSWEPSPTIDRAIDIAPQVAWLYNGRGLPSTPMTTSRPPWPTTTGPSPSTRTTASHFGTGAWPLPPTVSMKRRSPSYTEAIRLNPADPLSHLYRAEARCQVEDFEAAVIDFGEAIRLDPKQVRAYQGRAAAWEALEQDEEAEADYDAGRAPG